MLREKLLKMLGRLKRLVIGKPLRSEEVANERFGVLWGLPILSSDAISSVAYATQEILLVLIPAVGLLAYKCMAGVCAAIVGLLLILVLSYSQTIKEYPQGGGAYVVAKENIGITAGATAGAALAIDYIMTVAVSISSGVEQLISAIPALMPFKVLISVSIVLLITIINMRGISESSKILGLPAYLFIIGLSTLILVGFVRIFTGNYTIAPVPSANYYGFGSITIFLLLRAFSNGCTALSGVEAVSNAVPNFKDPSVKNARRVLFLIGIIITVLFGGSTVLALLYKVTPTENSTVLVQLTDLIIGQNTMFTSLVFYFIVATFVLILMLAANTAFSGFPMLVSVMARDSYMPRQFKNRGSRLSYSNGILALSAIAILLILVFKADVSKLIGLYAIGVFISFTLSQLGMCIKLAKEKKKGWIVRACINGFGCMVTFTAIIIVAVTKFTQGAWIVVILIPMFVLAMLKIKGHYSSVKEQLKVNPKEITIDVKSHYDNKVIVLLESINKASVRGIKYALTISDNVRVFSVVLNEEQEQKLRKNFDDLDVDVPLTIMYSPYRKIVKPLLEYIKSEEYDYKKGEMITVIMPHFSVKKKRFAVLHNHTQLLVERELLKHKHIVVADLPFQLK